MGRFFSFLVRCTTALPLLVAASVHAQQNWQDQNIYQIFTDRFFNGDVTNDNAEGNYNGSAAQAVHGGDFKGIEQKLDYIKALGATAIWISPVVQNGNGDYHGYAGRDFYKVAPHLGTLTDLKHLIDTAHGKGLLVIDDIVVNHGALLLNSNDTGYPNFRLSPPYNLFYRDNAKQYPTPFDTTDGRTIADLFHRNGFVQNFDDSTQLELGSFVGLDDFRIETTYVQTQMANIYEFWMDQGFDGFRVDTVKHVDHGFWDAWCPQIHQHAIDIGKPDFFMFGEVVMASEARNGSYTGTKNGGAFELDSVLDYPLYFDVNGVFARANSNTKQIEDHYHAVDANYDPAAQMRLVTFLDNHDQARFLNSANGNDNFQRLNVALAFLYTSRGIPCLYYGTEQGFDGGADPTNREDMFAGGYEQGPSLGDNFNETHPIFQLVAKLNNLRRLYPALRTGAHVNLWNNPNGPGLFAYSRVLGAQEIFVVFNTSTISQTLPARPVTYPAGTILTNLLDPNDSVQITTAGQTPSITLAGTTVKLYIAQAQIQPLDPVISAISPTHDQPNVPTPSKIVLTFSKPMDTASVEAAFSTAPVTTGTFAWSDAHDQLTFRTADGLPELTTISVHIDQAASAADGTHLHAPFDSRFATAVKTIQDVTPPTIRVDSPQPGASVSGDPSIDGWAYDDVAVAKVEVKVDDGPWRTAISGSPSANYFWYFNYDTSWDLNGTHTMSFRSIDTAGNVSDVSSVPLKFANVPPSYEENLYAYGSPGAGNWGCNNEFLWIGDSPFDGRIGYIGGNTYRSSNSIPNVCPQDQFLYQSERYGSSNDGFQYLFRCPPGVYQVDILDAETFMSGPNQRRFDIYAQGEKMIQNFDIFAAAGGANLGITRSFTVTVFNTLLDVQFTPIFDGPRVSAIHVKKVGDAASDPDGVPDWWRMMYFGHVNALAEDQSRAQDDPDHDGVNNLQESLAGTDPFNPTSNFRITSIYDFGTEVRVDIVAAPNKKYQLQRCSSLASGDWVNVGNPTVAYSSFAEVSDYSPDQIPNPKFYRVVIVP